MFELTDTHDSKLVLASADTSLLKSMKGEFLCIDPYVIHMVQSTPPRQALTDYFMLTTFAAEPKKSGETWDLSAINALYPTELEAEGWQFANLRELILYCMSHREPNLSLAAFEHGKIVPVARSDKNCGWSLGILSRDEIDPEKYLIVARQEVKESTRHIPSVN